MGILGVEVEMRLRDWLDPNTADLLIPVLGITMLVAPFVGAVIGYAVAQDPKVPKTRTTARGFVLGCAVSFVCFVVLGPLVREYWAG
jgi:hypothetical protein